MDRRFTPVRTQPNLLAGSPKHNTVTTKISGEDDWIGQATAPLELLTRRDSEPGKAGGKWMIDWSGGRGKKPDLAAKGENVMENESATELKLYGGEQECRLSNT
jgi:hypothetical protein